MSQADASTEAEAVKRHTIGQSIALHLGPGILIGAVYFALVQPIRNLGFPSIAALIVTALLILVPFELGFLLHQAKKTGTKGLKGVLRYREPVPLKAYLIWIPVIFLSSALIMTLLTPVSTYLESLFAWMPEAYQLEMGLSGGYSKPVLIVTYLLDLLLIALVAPTVEELYFRGYLLPRMPRNLKGWAPIAHSALFALYHTWTPWMVPVRTLAVLPLIYVVRWKKNLTLGIVAHCMLNAIDVVIGIVYILSLP